MGKVYFADFKEAAADFIAIVTTNEIVKYGIRSTTWNKKDYFEVNENDEEYGTCRNAKFEGTVVLKNGKQIEVDFFFDIENHIRRTIVGGISYGRFFPRIYINGEKYYSVDLLKKILNNAKSLA